MGAQTKNPADRLAIATLNERIGERARARGLSILALARKSGVSYFRLVTGKELREDELEAIQVALETASR